MSLLTLMRLESPLRAAAARRAAALALAVLLAPTFASAAQKKKPRAEEEIVPYSDVENDDEAPPPKREAAPRLPEEASDELNRRSGSLAGIDDPNIGLSVEAILGSMFLESSRGQGVEPRFMGGVRLTWEWARTVFRDEYWRESFFIDANWQATDWADGTRDVYTESRYHYFTLAPAWAFPFGRSVFSFFVSAGAGFNYSTMNLFVQQEQTVLSGTKLLVQYGAGFRARPAIIASGRVRVSLRLELTRFRRGYMDDTFFGGSLGLTF